MADKVQVACNHMREKEYSIIFSSGIFTGMSRKVLACGLSGGH